MVSLVFIADGLISLGSRIRPLSLKKWFFSFIFSFYAHVNRMKFVFFQFRLPVVVVSGVHKDTSDKICFLFVGREEFPLFLIDLLFCGKPNVEQIGHVFVWNLKSLDRSFSRDVDGVLVSCDRFYQRWLENAGLFVFPHMVDMVLDVSEPLDVFYKGLSNSAKADVRKVAKHGYSYEIFSDAKWLRFFYDAMYVPLIKSRFVDSPLYTPPFLFFRLLNMIGYQLLLVKDASGTFVSGCFFYVRKDELFSRYNGVLNGDFGLIRNGAESAFYYFLIDWAKKQGLNRIDLGYCRSFLNDGVFQYKRKWGAEMRKSDGTHLPDVFGIKVIKQKSSLKEFLKKDPCIGIDRKDNFIEYDVDGDD